MKAFGIGSLSHYSLADQVGEGTYGYVFKAVDKRNGDSVALKRFDFHCLCTFLSEVYSAKA